MKKKNNEKVGILGYGEVGKAVAKFYNDHKVKDLSRKDNFKGIDILNVCIPWSDKFSEIVEKEIKLSKPKLTIIHSTVEPGTTKQLSSKFKGMVVHSPVRGVHPRLHEGIRTFVKYIGADNKKAAELAKKHLESLGMKTEVFDSSTATELGKLLDTTYYGLTIAWHGEMKKLCDKFGVNFDETVTHFNNTYNEGYKELGKHNVVRPVLYPPEGPIGGHCVVFNAEILKKHLDSKGIDLILDYSKKSKKLDGRTLHPEQGKGYT